METLGLSIIALADGKPVKFTRDTRVYEHLYALIYGKLPRTKISVLKDKNVAKLIRFFEANGIDIDELTTFSEQAKKAMEGEPEALLDIPHDEVIEELREKQKKIEGYF